MIFYGLDLLSLGASGSYASRKKVSFHRPFGIGCSQGTIYQKPVSNIRELCNHSHRNVKKTSFHLPYRVSFEDLHLRNLYRG